MGVKTDRTTRFGAAILGICLGLTGCDSVIHGTQQITIVVTRPPANTPVSGISIKCVPKDHHRAGAPDSMPQEEYIAEFAGEPVKTNGLGRATATLRVFSVYGSTYHTVLPFLEVPSTPRDEVSGVEYLFKVEGTMGTEFLPLLMKPGETVEGEHFRLTVESIGRPVPQRPDL